MDCLDNERRPHFPQFSYSASGREWTIHRSDIITAGFWGHHCGTKRPITLDWPRTTLTWRICPSPLLPLFFTSPGHFSIFIFVNAFLEGTSRQNYPLIQHCDPRWSEVWCDQLLCNVPLMSGASPVACCALTCVDPAELKKNKQKTNTSEQLMHF